MKRTHDNRLGAAARVREPVQVYLDAAEQDRLERLRRQLSATKSDVLRRGLEALERELVDPARHPALRIIGLVEVEGEGAGSGGARESAGGGSGRRARRAR